jgi:hypothetical protein
VKIKQGSIGKQQQKKDPECKMAEINPIVKKGIYEKNKKSENPRYRIGLRNFCRFPRLQKKNMRSDAEQCNECPDKEGLKRDEEQHGCLLTIIDMYT